MYVRRLQLKTFMPSVVPLFDHGVRDNQLVWRHEELVELRLLGAASMLCILCCVITMLCRRFDISLLF